MSENIVNNTTNTTVLTEKEVFDQIVLLQKQLTENSPTSLHRLGEALYDARGEGEDAKLTDDQVSEICTVFAQREETLNQTLSLYQRMYNDFQKEKNEKKGLDSESVFEQINKIREDNAHIFDALRQLETVKSEGPQDIGAHGRAQGIADVVKCRETTNQRLLDFYERAYNDLREQEQQAKKRSEPESEDMAKRRKEFLDFVKETTTVAAGASIGTSPALLPDFDKIWKTVFLGE